MQQSPHKASPQHKTPVGESEGKCYINKELIWSRPHTRCFLPVFITGFQADVNNAWKLRNREVGQ